MTERVETRRYLVKVSDVVWGEQIYPRIPPHERLIIDPAAMLPLERKHVANDVYGEAIYEVIARKIPDKQTLNYFQVIMLVQRFICSPNVDKITIRAVG